MRDRRKVVRWDGDLYLLLFIVTGPPPAVGNDGEILDPGFRSLL